MRVRKTKRLLAGLLAAVFVLFSLPAGALAEGLSGPQAASVTVEDVTIIEGTNGYEAMDYDSETGEYIPYYRYDYFPSFTVTLTDGTVLEGNGGVEYEGKWYYLSYEDGQSGETPWGVGEHTATASIMGAEAAFTVRIVESPVEKIEVEPITYVEGTNGYETTDYDYVTDSESAPYYRYNYYPSATVTLTDGTVLEGCYDLDYEGLSYDLECTDPQSAAAPWGVGSHTVEGRLAGSDFTFTVRIVESPVEKIEVEPITIIEGSDGYERTDYSTGITYFHYNYSPYLTVTMADGTLLEGVYSTDYEGEYYAREYSDPQSVENPWGVGVHTVEGSFLGKDFTFTVEIIESPYVALEVVEVEPLRQGDDGSPDGNGGVSYPIPGFFFKVTSKDGSSFTGYSKGDTVVTATSDQATHPWTPGGENLFTVQYLNVTAQASAILEPAADFEYLEQDGGLLVTGCNDIAGDTVTIPSQIDGKPVTGLLSLGNASQTVRHVILPDSVTTIGESAFADTYQLQTVTVGSGVRHLDLDMFRYCYGLTAVSVAGDNPHYTDIGGVVYNKAGDTLVFYPFGKGENYVVPAGVANIDILGDTGYDFLNISFDPASTRFVTEDGVTYDAGKTKVIFCDREKAGAYDMPDTVTQILDGAFEGCAQLTGVAVSENVTSIVYRAFADCASLAEVSLPEKLQSIDAQAFAGAGLESIDIPEGTTSIGEYAFSDCGNLTGIVIPEGMTSIGADAFHDCSNLTDITIPGGVTYIGHGAFSSCMKLRTITILEGVTSIGDYAFGSCASLTDVTIPDSVTHIGAGAFSNCTSLTELAIPDSVTYIGDRAFSGCPLKEVNLPQGMKDTGGGYTFSETAITSLTLPESVTTITYRAFYNCSALADIDIPAGVISMQGYAFDGTAWYDAQPDGPVYLEHVFYGYKGGMQADAALELKAGTTVVADFALENRETLKTLTLPEGLKTLGSYSLHNCNSLTELYIPASVTQIDTSAFVGCSSLASIEVDPANTRYKSVDGVLFDRSGSTLLWCPRRDATWYEVPAGVERIATGAFSESGVNALKIRDQDIVFEDYSVGYRAYGRTGGGYYDGDFGYGGCDFDYQYVEIICPAESTAYAYAKQNHLLATVPDEVELESPDSGVSLTTTEDVLEPGTQLVVEPKEVESLVIVGADNYRLDTAVAFDISLENAGQTVQPNGTVTVSIPVPEGLDGKRCRVLYIREDGTITNMKAVYENGCLVFDTTHFSQYMVAEAEVIYGDVTGEGDVTATDALNVLQHVTGKIKLEGTALQAADVDGQNGITANDALQILQFATRKIDLFPVEG